MDLFVLWLEFQFSNLQYVFFFSEFHNIQKIFLKTVMKKMGYQADRFNDNLKLYFHI